MKKFLLFALLLVTVIFTSCTKIENGYTGLKVSLLGDEKGSIEEVPPGYYLDTINKQHLAYPNFVQYAVWTEDSRESSKTDEALRFQSNEGLEIVADIGMDYSFSGEPGSVAKIYSKYRKTPQDIADIAIRQKVRDALTRYGSTYSADQIISEGKTELMEKVYKEVRDYFAPEIIINGVYWIGAPRPPEQVLEALNAKVAAKQKAQQRENEVLEAKAEADKQIEAARGIAEYNKIVSASLTKELVEFEKIKKWDGHLPTVAGGDGTSTIIDMRSSN